MSEYFRFQEAFPITGSSFRAEPDSRTSLSSRLFSDPAFASDLQNFSAPLASASDTAVAKAQLPFLSETMKQRVSASDLLSFSSALDNKAAGVEPDFRIVLGTDGKLRLEPIKQGDPLSDGKLNIEMDTNNKTLVEAIKQADANLKEFIREMISYWIKNHPGSAYPSWWDQILASTPYTPDNAVAPAVEMTPQQFRPPSETAPEPPASPQSGWQPDYRGGAGPGYRPPGGGSDYYHGGGGGGGGGGNGSDYSLPNAVPIFDDSTGFIDRLAGAIMKNEGALNEDGSPRFTAYNADDNGGISVGLRQWHAGGALPELLNAWQDKSPGKFHEYFKGYSPAQINAMSSSEFASHPELVDGMKTALKDPEYQEVQKTLLNDWVKREVKMGMGMGLKGERELAVFVDIANQYGQDSASSAATLGRKSGDQGEAMNNYIRGGQYAERFAFINQSFSTQDASLSENLPRPGAFAQQLTEAIKTWDARMSGTGACAAAVQSALADVKLPQFVGSGNAWEMLGPLERSGLFVRVPQSEAAVGDLIIRPPSANPNDNSVYGDISVVTAGQGDRIVQTNDASYDFVKNNSRYDGKAVFLRFVGEDKSDTRVASLSGHDEVKESKKV